MENIYGATDYTGKVKASSAMDAGLGYLNILSILKSLLRIRKMTDNYDPRNTCSECGEVLPMQAGGWQINKKGPMCIGCFVKEDVIMYTKKEDEE